MEGGGDGRGPAARAGANDYLINPGPGERAAGSQGAIPRQQPGSRARFSLSSKLVKGSA
jgi:hypothetical protein